MNPYLLLWLEAPLQAWGHDSRFGRRDSLDFPTKSGTLGLLCCARGAGGEEREWLADTVIAWLYKHCPPESGLLIVRAMSRPPGYELRCIGPPRKPMIEVSGLQLIVETLRGQDPTPSGGED